MRYRIRPGESPNGTVPVPGDKSVTHRAFLLGAVARGETLVTGPNVGADCLATAEALRRLGAEIRTEPGGFLVRGREGRLVRPAGRLDMGNSGTGARLLAGLLAGQPFAATIDGDESLRSRPMGRIAGPLRQMGASIEGREGGDRLPLTVRGGALRGIRYETPVASAQIKSAILLAGLFAQGRTEVIEPGPSRDHTERMIAYLGGKIECGSLRAALTGGQMLEGRRIDVGGDPSSSAFFVTAGLILPGARVTLEGILNNERRTAFLDVLERMGGNILREPVSTCGPEERMNVTVCESALRGTEIGGDEVPRLIDEIPILAVAGAVASGDFLVQGAEELRVKESDRIVRIVQMLGAFGALVEERPDGFLVRGGTLRGGVVESGGDHRIAMAAAVAGLAAKGETVVEDVACVSTSLPEFLPIWRKLGVSGAALEEEG